MKKFVLFRQGIDQPLELVVLAIFDWEGFEKLIQFVEKYYNATIIKKYDGPGARKWILESNSLSFELIHDDGYGNYFVAPTKSSENLLIEIGRDLEERLSKVREN